MSDSLHYEWLHTYHKMKGMLQTSSLNSSQKFATANRLYMPKLRLHPLYPSNLDPTDFIAFIHSLDLLSVQIRKLANETPIEWEGTQMKLPTLVPSGKLRVPSI